MARPWEQIEADPEFQALAPDRRAILQQTWFQENALPKLAPDRVNAFREFFFAKYPHGNQDPEFGQPLSEGMMAGAEQGLQKGLTATFLSGPGSILKALGADDNPLLETGRAMEAGIEADSPISRENQQRFPVKAANAVGQAASMVLTAPLAGTRPAQGFDALYRARQLALMGGLQGASAGEEEATRLGITSPLAKAGAILGFGAIEAVSERVGGYGVEQGLWRILRGQAVGPRGFAKAVTRGAAVEGFEEVVAGVPQRALASGLAEEDPMRPGFTPEGQPIYSPADVGMAMEEFGLGAIAGGAIVGVRNIFEQMTPQQQQDTQNVARLPDEVRAQTFDALQQVSAEQQRALAQVPGMDESTAAAMRVTFDGRRAAVLGAAQQQVAQEFQPGWEQRERAGLTFTGEEQDAYFQNGQWVVSTGMDAQGQPVFAPAPNAKELEAERQEWIKTGQMPEGMQPLQAALTTPTNEATQGTENQVTPPSAVPDVQGQPTVQTPEGQAPQGTAQPQSQGAQAVAPEAATMSIPAANQDGTVAPEFDTTGAVWAGEETVTVDKLSTVRKVRLPNGETRWVLMSAGGVPALPSRIRSHIQRNSAEEFAQQNPTLVTPQTPSATVPTSDAEALTTREFARDELQALPVIASGSESDVLDEGPTVLKVGEPYNAAESLAARVRETLRGDQLAGDQTLEYAGFYRGRNGILNPVFRQQKFEGQPATPEQVRAHMEAKGWTQLPDGRFQITTEEGLVTTTADLQNGENAVVDEQGGVHLLDVTTSVEAAPAPSVEQRVEAAESPAAQQAILAAEAPVAALEQELSTMSPVAVADRLREAGVDELTVAEVTEPEVQTRAAAEAILAPVAPEITADQAQAEGVEPVVGQERATERVQPDEFESRLRETIREEGLRGWTDADVMAAVRFHATGNPDELTSQPKRSVVGRVELAMRTPAERRAQARAERRQRATRAPEILTPATAPLTLEPDDQSVAEPQPASRADVPPNVERRTHAVERTLGGIASSGGATLRWVEPDDGPTLRVVTSPDGSSVLEATRGYARAVASLSAPRRHEEMRKARSLVALHSALGTTVSQLPNEFPAAWGLDLTPQQQASQAVYSAMQAQADTMPVFPDIQAVGLELANGQPYSSSVVREMDLVSLRWRTGREASNAVQWTDHLLRLAAERAQGRISEDAGGMFFGYPEWRPRVNGTLDLFNTAAARGDFGPVTQRVLENAANAYRQSAVPFARAMEEDALVMREIEREEGRTIQPLGVSEAAARGQSNPYAEGVAQAAAERSDQDVTFVQTAREAPRPALIQGAPAATDVTGQTIVVTDQVRVTEDDRRAADQKGTTAAAEALDRVIGQSRATRDVEPEILDAQVGDVLEGMQNSQQWAAFVDDLWDTHTEELEEIVEESIPDSSNDEVAALNASDNPAQDLLDGKAPTVMAWATRTAIKVRDFASFVRSGVARFGRGFINIAADVWRAVRSAAIISLGFAGLSTHAPSPRVQGQPDSPPAASDIMALPGAARGQSPQLDPSVRPLEGDALLDGTAVVDLNLRPEVVTERNVPLSELRGTEPQAPASADSNTGRVAQWIRRNNDNQGSPFIIADKRAGTVTVFNGDGRQTKVMPALFGKEKGDQFTGTSSRVTPSGRFPINTTDIGFYASPEENAADMGLAIDVVDHPSEGYVVAIHQLYLEDPSERREQRLLSIDPSDNRISYGCINLDASNMSELLEVFSEGGYVYILPETASGRSSFEGFRALPSNTKNEAASAWLEENFGPQMVDALSGQATPEQVLSSGATPFIAKCERFVRTELETYLKSNPMRFSASVPTDANNNEIEAAKRAGFTIKAFHGSPVNNITRFNEAEQGIAFSDKETTAQGYMLRRGLWRSPSSTGRVYEALLKIENPLEIDALGARNNNIPFPGQEWKPTVFGNLPANAVGVMEAAEKAFSQGHDALIVRNVLDTADPTARQKSTVYVVKSASQIFIVQPGAQGNDLRFSAEAPPSRPRRVLAIGVSRASVDRAVEGAQELLPTLASAWVGTREELGAYMRGSRDVKLAWVRQWRSNPANKGDTEDVNEAFEDFINYGLNNVEGFALDGRSYVITDQVRVYDTNGNEANAARRVLMEEDTHIVVDHKRNTDEAFNEKWERYRDEVPAVELDELVPSYPWLAEWRASPDIKDALFHEWMAKKIQEIEVRGQPAADSLFGRILNWLKGVWRSLFGPGLEPSDRELLDFIDSARAAYWASINGEGVSPGARFSTGDASARSTVDPQVESGPWASPPLESLNSQVYNLWTQARREEFLAMQSNPDIPDDLKHLAQFMGGETDQLRITQTLAPMQEMARSKLGGLNNERPEVTPENTATAYAMGRRLLQRSTFSRRYIEEFRDFWSPRVNGVPIHAGDAAVAVLQLELMDYAKRLNAQTGDSRLATQLAPFSNDAMLGFYQTASAAGRVLQVRSVASRDGGYYSALKSAAADTRKGAERYKEKGRARIGPTAVDTLAGAVDPMQNQQIGQEVVLQLAEVANDPQAQEEFAQQAEEYESEGWWNRALEAVDAQEQADLRELERRMRRLDELLQLQKSRQAVAASQARPSMAADQQAFVTEESLEAAIQSEIAAIKGVLGRLNGSATSSETKAKRRQRVNNAQTQRARKTLSADEQAKAALERFAERNQRVRREKPQWRKTFEQQVREPRLTADFVADMEAQGITPDTSLRLAEVADQLHDERESAARQRGLQRSRQETERDEAREAEIRDKMARQKAKEQARALNLSMAEEARLAEANRRAEEEKQAKRKADLKKYYDEIDRAERKEAEVQAKMAAQRAKAQTKAENRAEAEELKRQQREARQAAEEARKKADALEREEREENEMLYRASVELVGPPLRRKAPPRASFRMMVSSLASQLVQTPLAQQGDPQWVKEAVENAFAEMGFPPALCQKYAAKIAPRFTSLLRAAQERAATAAVKRLGMSKLTTQAITEAIRSGVWDPVNPNPAIRGLAAQAGYQTLTQAEFQALAQLDEDINSGFPTLAADAFTRVERILSRVRPRKPIQQLWAQLFTNGALGSLGVFALNWLHPAYTLPRRLTTDIGGLIGDAIAGKGDREQNLRACGHIFTNLWKARQNFLNDARFSLANDAYSNKMLEILQAEHSLYRELMDAVEQARTGNPATRAWAVTKIAWLSSDWVRRMLATADQTWGSVLQEFVLRNEAMRMMIQEAGLTTEAAALVLDNAAREAAAYREQCLQAGMEPVKAALVARDVMQESLARGLTSLIPERQEDMTAGQRLLLTAKTEGLVELGNQPSDFPKTQAKDFLGSIPLWDVPAVLLESFKAAASAVRSKSELIGRPLTGFITVAANILNRGFYFTPLGFARVWSKTRANAERRKLIYAETQATAAQSRMRLYEAIGGTIALALLELFRWRPEDKEWGISVTGNGPKTGGLRDSWLKLHKPFHVELLDGNGTVLASISYGRGGLDHMSPALIFAGARTDVELEGKRPNKKPVDWAWAYTQTVVGNNWKHAQFFGAKALFNSTPTSTKPNAVVSQIGYTVQPFTPWGGLVKSVSSVLSGPTERGSWRTALASNLIVAQPVLGRPGPALNFLGDQIGAPPNVWDRAEYAGFPFFVSVEPSAENDRIYRFLLEKAVAPSMPVRSLVERQNDFLTDAQWNEYVRLRGSLIKRALLQQMTRLEKLDSVDLAQAIESLSSAATSQAKRTLKLK